MKNYKLKTLLTIFCIIGLYSCQQDEFTDDLESEQDDSIKEVLKASYPKNLNFGFHFINSYGSYRKGIDQNTNVPYSLSDDYYDPDKKTIIFFHGWQTGQNRQYILTNYSGKGNVTKKWKDLGWNVAVFFWDDFAIEGEVQHAEAKIHSHKGPKAMNFTDEKGSYSASGINLSVTSLALGQYKAIFKNQKQPVRFAGHSLGSQLACSLGYVIAIQEQAGSVPRMIVPNRIELLDPFWSKGTKSYLGTSTGKKTETYCRYLIDNYNVPITWYKSSAFSNVGIGDLNRSLSRYVAYQHNKFWYLGPPGFSNGIGVKHNEIPFTYFNSIQYAAPAEVDYKFPRRKIYTGYKAASASSTNSEIRRMMIRNKEWRQTEGRRTETPADDQFEMFNKK